jgi:hypothetical protein
LSNGIVNELYYPPVDRPNTRDFQLLITDEETFCHEEKRDLDHAIDYPERVKSLASFAAPRPLLCQGQGFFSRPANSAEDFILQACAAKRTGPLSSRLPMRPAPPSSGAAGTECICPVPPLWNFTI